MEKMSLAKGNTIERVKSIKSKFKYFVADINGYKKRVLSDYFTNPKEVASIKYSLDNHNEKGDLFFKFYEFIDEDVFPKYIQNFIEETGKLEIGEIKGDDNIIVKALVNDNGDVLLNCIKSVDRFLPEIGFIVTIYKLSYPRNCNDGFQYTIDELKCVINLFGEYLIEPTYNNIEFSDVHKIIIVDNSQYYDINGHVLSVKLVPKFYGYFETENLYNDYLKENENESRYREQYEITVEHRDEETKFGIIKNGKHLISPQYRRILRTVWGNIFIAFDGKYSFIYEQLDSFGYLMEAELKVSNIRYDQIIELSKKAGYLCVLESGCVIDYYIGLNEIFSRPNGIRERYKFFDNHNLQGDNVNSTNILKNIKKVFQRVKEDHLDDDEVLIKRGTWGGSWSNSYLLKQLNKER